MNVAIFASGTGSNAAKIIDYFQDHSTIRIALIVSNRKDAGVLEIAKTHQIPTLIISRASFYRSNQILFDLAKSHIDFIILAGFLLLIPAYLIQSFPNKIINIHPALLPKYGGKGMYGMHVHEAVKAAGELESGITIHFVNEQYDAGAIIFQISCPILTEDDPTTIRNKVLKLEHKYFPEIAEKVMLKQKIVTQYPSA